MEINKHTKILCVHCGNIMNTSGKRMITGLYNFRCANKTCDNLSQVTEEGIYRRKVKPELMFQPKKIRELAAEGLVKKPKKARIFNKPRFKGNKKITIPNLSHGIKVPCKKCGKILHTTGKKNKRNHFAFRCLNCNFQTDYSKAGVDKRKI